MFFSGTPISCTNYITHRNEVSKWSIQMLGNVRFTVVRCLSCTEWGGSPVENKYVVHSAVVQVKAIKLGGIRRGRTEPIQVGSSLVFLNLKAWFSLILMLIQFLSNLLLSILTKKKMKWRMFSSVNYWWTTAPYSDAYIDLELSICSGGICQTHLICWWQ